MAKALRYLTSGYGKDVHEVLNEALFTEEYDEMVVVKDIDFYSMCVPGKQSVNAVNGAKPAREVLVGDRLWTLDRGHLKETTVTAVTSRKTRAVVEVRTAAGRIRLTPDHPVMTDGGWREAGRLTPGAQVEWINPGRSAAENRNPVQAIRSATSSGPLPRTATCRMAAGSRSSSSLRSSPRNTDRCSGRRSSRRARRLSG